MGLHRRGLPRPKRTVHNVVYMYRLPGGRPTLLAHVAPGEIAAGANPCLRVEVAYPQGHISATGHHQAPFRAYVDRNDVAAVRRDSCHRVLGEASAAVGEFETGNGFR